MWGSKVEGSHATARSTAELLRSVISQQRVPSNIQAEALIEAVKVVGEKLTAANPVGMHSNLFLCYDYFCSMMINCLAKSIIHTVYTIYECYDRLR